MNHQDRSGSRKSPGPATATAPRGCLDDTLFAPWVLRSFGLLLACLSPPALAQTWPSKPVRRVLRFPPGGATDSVARILAQAMSATLGKAFRDAGMTPE